MQRKLKICKTCKLPSYLWAYGNCKDCDGKLRAEKEKSTRPEQSIARKEIVAVRGDNEPIMPRIVKLVDEINIAILKKRQQESKSIPDLLKLAQIVVNKYVRERDSKDGMFTCISSGEYLPVSQMQAGHFFPISTSSYLRYDLSNIHGQSISENCFNPNHILTYRKNLIKKIGIEEVARLDYYHNREKKWSKDELLEIIQKYKI